MTDMFTRIKKQNGERFAKAIRAYDSGIFDIENLERIVQYAGRQAEPIMDFLISLKGVEIAEHTVSKTPLQLLDEAGYDAYYADTLEKQNAIRHYYANKATLRALADEGRISPNYAYGGEELCTFKDPSRFREYYIINAVRKDVDEIRREDFPNPKREDTYGTSVLSIQILKTGGFISIKNRYNHTVQNPDNTLNSDPDRIIEGLSMAIKQHFNVDFSSQAVTLPHNYIFINGQIIKYGKEINNIYIGDGFYVKDGIVTTIDRDFQEILDYQFLLDKRSGTVTDVTGWDGSFAQVLENEIRGKKLSVSRNKETQETIISVNGQELCAMKGGRFCRLTLWETTELPDRFLSGDDFQELEVFNAPKLKRIGNHSFTRNTCPMIVNCPEVEEVGDHSFERVSGAMIYMPKLKKVGNNTLDFWGPVLNHTLDCLEEVGNKSLIYVSTSSFPHLKKVGDYFASSARYEKGVTLSAPELEEVGNGAFFNVQAVSVIDFPNLRIAGDNFLREVGWGHDKHINLPNLEQVGENFMCGDAGWGDVQPDYSLAEFYAPKLKIVGNCFMKRCADIQKQNMPSEINVQVHFCESEISSFMPNMSSEKRPKPVAMASMFKLVLDEDDILLSTQNNVNEPSQKPETIGEDVSVHTSKQTQLTQQMELKKKLYARAKREKSAKNISVAYGLFSKRNR